MSLSQLILHFHMMNRGLDRNKSGSTLIHSTRILVIMEISLTLDDNLSTLGVILSTFWIYLSFSKFRHPLLRSIFQEQKAQVP
jgi:hypothetical protein